MIRLKKRIIIIIISNVTLILLYYVDSYSFTSEYFMWLALAFGIRNGHCHPRCQN